jgi:tetraacyldisaccharide 4'-kinase
VRGFWPGLQRGGLWLSSLPYAWAARLRNRLYDRGWKRSYRPPVAVVSLGNLTLGGTGKTPGVEYVARFYRDRNLRVAILSRGYGSVGGRNDEALVLEENLPDVPHLQGADRVQLAQIAALELESEILVLDDGFQHRRLARDLDLVLLDATDPWGPGYLFPRGFLREPPASLGRAGVVMLTRCDQVKRSVVDDLRQRVARYAGQAAIVETVHRPMELLNGEHQSAPIGELAGRPVAGFCGIGNPDAFRQTLASLEADVVAFRTFPDHHAYTRADVEDLRTWAGQQVADCMIVTTQKDMVKLRLSRLSGRSLWALRICLQVERGQESLDCKLLSVVSSQ